MADWNIASSVKEKERGRSIMVWPETITLKSWKIIKKKCKKLDEKKRIAFLLLIAGFNGRKVSNLLKISYRTITRWKRSDM